MSNSGEGVVKDGKWNRGKGEYSKSRLKEMKRFINWEIDEVLLLKSPLPFLGSICAISEGGRIVDILSRKQQLSKGAEQLRDNEISADFTSLANSRFPSL